jgi:hypothetical protein
LLCTGFRFLRRNSHRQIRSSIGRPTQSHGYAPETVCLTAKSKRSDPEKHSRENCECRDNYRPSVPPHDTAVDPQARARTNALPPAHSLIPLWTGGHSATPMQREEIAHG